jgi:hypothetical protein
MDGTLDFIFEISKRESAARVIVVIHLISQICDCVILALRYAFPDLPRRLCILADQTSQLPNNACGDCCVDNYENKNNARSKG